MNDKASKGSEMHLRAFCCKATGGGGRLRQAMERDTVCCRGDVS